MFKGKFQQLLCAARFLSSILLHLGIKGDGQTAQPSRRVSDLNQVRPEWMPLLSSTHSEESQHDFQNSRSDLWFIHPLICSLCSFCYGFYFSFSLTLYKGLSSFFPPFSFLFLFFPSGADLALSQHIRANYYQLWKVCGPRARFLAQLQELFPSPLQRDLPMGLPVCRNQLLHVQAHTAEMTISFLHPISQKQSNPPSFFKVANVSVQLLEADLCPSVPAQGTAFRAVYGLLAQQYKNSRPHL